ncbi:hypothetical protein [Streptomyces sp. 35G-GA-8]|uniref:hypothetical protein n=1 Tax=Streptomyces sp. 35G-GA-8 TaxID=2939434 RepID=UPI00201F7828|nr:hypothetical protein [Streptomyces sp. 35G-GA-8]MCL7376556.1 hypothetical protein [Streptomyces sp. 35G-GA-8]
MILMGVAVTAVSGCMAVEPHASPGPSPRPGTSSGIQPPGAPEPLIIEAPAKEALEAVVPPSAPRSAPRSSAESRPPARDRPTPDRTNGSTRPPATSRPERRHEDRPEEQRHSTPSPAPAIADVCALGERYGQWPKDSPQARICRDTYGD